VQAIIFVYDVTNPASFKDLEDWLAKVQSLFQPSEMPYLALVGNKMDLTHIRAVKAEKHAKFADANNMFSFLLSVRLGDLVRPDFLCQSVKSLRFSMTRKPVDTLSHMIRMHTRSLRPSPFSSSRALDARRL
jgi:Ras-related protein Rab-28